MAEYEREVRTTTTEGDPAYVRTRTTDDPDSVTYVRRGAGAAPWLIAAIVAVVAIIAIAFLMTGRDEPTGDELAAAVDAGRAAGYVEGAATAVGDMSAPVTVPVPVPVPVDSGASVYAERSAAEAAAAAADARAAAERAADSAASANDPDTSVSSNTTP